MNICRSLLVIAAASFGFAGALPANSHAQEVNARCNAIGPRAMEPLSQQKGHVLQTSVLSCVVEGGTLDGAVMTSTTLWEYEGGTEAVLVAGINVYRKADGIAVLQHEQGKLQVQIENGKPTGWTASGVGIYKLGTGSLGDIEGKRADWTSKPTGAGQVYINAAYR